jgi:hypothetical protein
VFKIDLLAKYLPGANHLNVTILPIKCNSYCQIGRRKETFSHLPALFAAAHRNHLVGRAIMTTSAMRQVIMRA